MLSACRKEDGLVKNSDPETHIFLNKIDRSGVNRLNTIVHMHWSGEDKDGYVVAYEISFDNINWSLTAKQDTVFSFSIDSGSDTTDIDFYVRAIDNDGNKDKTPAYLKIPIKNTVPTISLDQNMIKSDTVYSVFSLLWTATDLDGFENLDSIYIKINTSDWYAVSKNYSFVTIVPETPEAIGSTDAKVFLGYDTLLSAKRIKGLTVGASNQIQVKVKDVSGAESEIDSLDLFFLKRKTSDLLLLDAYNIAATPSADDVYRTTVSAAYGIYDYYNFYQNSNANIPAVWMPTFRMFMGLYDKVVWYSDNIASTNNAMLLELGATAIQAYLNKNGKLMILSDFDNRPVPNSFPIISTVFQFSPMDSFQTFYANNQNATLPVDSLAIPDPVDGIGYPLLKVSHFMGSVDPFFPKSNAKIIYRAQIRRAVGVSNTKAIAAKTQNIQGKTNQVFFSAELFKMQADADGNGQQDELRKVFEKVLLDEFNW